MDSLLTYIVQVNMLLAMLYMGYILLLKDLTFYSLNRIYFIIGAGFSLLYPFLDIKALFRRHAEPIGELIDFFPAFSTDPDNVSIYTLENLIYAFLGMGVLVFTGKLLIQLVSLLRIHHHSVDASWKSYLYRNVFFPIVPFSFLNKIYVNKDQHQELELQDIFEHENIHVKGLHTIDILLFEIVLISCWYNPLVWLMRRAVRQNLEFLTDQQVLSNGIDRQTYQYSLLHVSKQGMAVGISNRFNFKLLKKRIMMMNKRRSSRLALSKYAFLLPVIIFFAGAFTVSKADDHIAGAVQTAKQTDLQDIFKQDSALPIKREDTTPGAFVEGLPIDTIGGGGESRTDSTNIVAGTRMAGDRIGTTIGAVPLVTERDTLDLRASKKRVRLSGENAPLLIIDGKIDLKRDFEAIDPNSIQEIHVLKGTAALTKYGAQAKDGAIEMTTKGYAATLSGKMEKLKLERDTVRLRSVVVKGYNSNGTQNAAQQDTSKAKAIIFRGVKKEGAQPLIVVDGVAQAKAYDLGKDISPDKIESITVVKDASAEHLYGEKGKDGVIMITTKAGKRSSVKRDVTYTDDDVFFVDGTPVSKNEFKAVPEKDIATIETSGDPDKGGRRIEIKTR